MTSVLFNPRKVFVDDLEQEADPEKCPECATKGRTGYLRFFYFNMHHSLEKCNHPKCMYPFKGFRFRDQGDPRTYRYLYKTVPTTKGAPNGWRHSSVWDIRPLALPKMSDRPNERKVFVDDLEQEADPGECPACAKQGRTEYLRFYYINYTHSMEKCNHTTCMYPFEGYRFREHGDPRIYRYEKVPTTEDEKPIDSLNQTAFLQSDSLSVIDLTRESTPEPSTSAAIERPNATEPHLNTIPPKHHPSIL